MTSYPPALIHIFQQTGRLSPEETAHLLTFWKQHFTLKRNEFLITPDRREQYMYFVISGTQRLYCVDANGEEATIGFAYTDTLTGSYPSLITGKPANIYIQALSDCELIGILWQDFERLSIEIPNVERCRRILAEATLMGRLQREIEMLTLSPAQRYEQFMQRSAHLFQLVPQKHIASYLGMTPETLSRIRKR